jgi:branched-chain amino acid transport system permease protein
MVYGILRLIHFAHGDIMMTVAFSGYFLSSQLASCRYLEEFSMILMLLVVAAMTALIAAVLNERLAYRPFRRPRRSRLGFAGDSGLG